MKRLLVISIVFLLFCLISLTLVPYFSRVFIGPLKNTIEKRLEETTHCSVSIKRIRFLFLNYAVIDRMTLGPQEVVTQAPYCTISRIFIRFNIVSLVGNHQQPLKAVSKIKIIDFDCLLSDDIFKKNLSATAYAIPEIAWDRGSIRIIDKRKSSTPYTIISMSKCSGSLKRGRRGSRLFAEGFITDMGSIQISGLMDTQGEWNAEVNSRLHHAAGVDILRVGNLREKSVGLPEFLRTGSFNGMSSVVIRAAGSVIDAKPIIAAWHASCAVSSGTLTAIAEDKRIQWHVRGQASVSSQELVLSSAVITSVQGSEVIVNGAVKDPFDTQSFSLRVRIPTLDMRDMPGQELPSFARLINLRSGMSGVISGTREAPVITVNLNNSEWLSEESVGGNVSGDLYYESSNWRISNFIMTVDSGTIRAEAHGIPQDWFISTSFDSVDMARFFPMILRKQLTGTMDGSITFRGRPSYLDADGSWRLSNVSVLGQPFQQLNGKLLIRDQQITVDTVSEEKDFLLNINIRRKEEALILNRFVVRSPYVNADGSGSLSTIDNQMDISLEATGIPVNRIHLPFALHRRLKGAAYFKGSLQRAWKDPLISGFLKIADNENEYGTAQIVFDSRYARITDMAVCDALTGSVTWDLKNDELEISLKEKDVDAGRLSALFGVPVESAGSITGGQRLTRKRKKTEIISTADSGLFNTLKNKVQSLVPHEKIKKSEFMWEGESSFVWRDGGINAMRFQTFRMDVSLDESYVKLNEFSIQQDSGTLDAQGRIDFDRTRDNVSATVKCKHWSWDPFFFDGELSVAGDYATRYRATMNMYSPTFWINGKHTGELKGLCTFNEGIIEATDWSIGSFFTGDLSIDGRADPPTVNGTAFLNLIDMQFLKEITSFDQLRTMRGTGAVSAGITGTLRNPVITMTVKIPDARWDTLLVTVDGTMHYENRQWTVSGMMLDFHDKGRLRIEGKYNEQNGVRVPLFNAEIEHLDIALIDLFTEFPPWLHGNINGTIHITGTLEEPVFSGNLHGDTLSLHTVTIDRWDGDVELKNNTLHINALHLMRGGAWWNVTGGSYLTFASDKQVSFRMNLELRNVYVGAVSLFGGLTVVGGWDFSDSQPNELHIVTKHLWVNQHDFERVSVPVTVEKKIVSLRTLEQERYRMSGFVDISSYPCVHIHDVRLDEKERTLFHMNGMVCKEHLDFWFKTVDIDAATIFGLLDYEKIITGAANMYMVVSGTLSNPRVVCSITSQNGRIVNIPYAHLQSHVILRDGIVVVEQGVISSPGLLELKVNGSIPFRPFTEQSEQSSPQVPVDLSVAVSQGDLKIISHAFEAINDARGSLTGRLSIKGTADKPMYSGYMSLSDGSLSAEKYVKSIRRAAGLIRFNNDTVVLEECSAQMGDGLLEISGEAHLALFEIRDMNFRIATAGKKGIRIEAPFLPISASPIFTRLTTTSRGNPRIAIAVTGSSEEPLITGDFFLDDTFFTYPPPAQVKRNMSKTENPFLQFICRAGWDVNIHAGENTWYENEYANAQINGTIAILGKYPDFKVGGKVESTKGSIGFLGTEFDINRAVLEIIPSPVEPPVTGDEWRNVLYLEGTAEASAFYHESYAENSIEDTITMVMDRATIGNLKPRFVSRNNPGLASDKALERATGYSAENIDPQEYDVLLRRGIIQILDATLTTPLARSIARQTGLIDTVRISHESLQPDDPFARDQKEGYGFIGGDLRDAFLGTKYTLGKSLSSNLLLEYSMQITGSRTRLDLKHELELSYRLHRDTYIRGVADLGKTYTGLEPERKAIIERQWRFGWPPKWWKYLKKSFK